MLTEGLSNASQTVAATTIVADTRHSCQSGHKGFQRLGNASADPNPSGPVNSLQNQRPRSRAESRSASRWSGYRHGSGRGNQTLRKVSCQRSDAPTTSKGSTRVSPTQSSFLVKKYRRGIARRFSCRVGLFETIFSNKTGENLPFLMDFQNSEIVRKPFTAFGFSNIVAKSPTSIEGLPVSLPKLHSKIAHQSVQANLDFAYQLFLSSSRSFSI